MSIIHTTKFCNLVLAIKSTLHKIKRAFLLKWSITRCKLFSMHPIHLIHELITAQIHGALPLGIPYILNPEHISLNDGQGIQTWRFEFPHWFVVLKISYDLNQRSLEIIRTDGDPLELDITVRNQIDNVVTEQLIMNIPFRNTLLTHLVHYHNSMMLRQRGIAG